MKQFMTILRFEFKAYLKNKLFIGSTVFLMLAIGVFLFIPRFNQGNGGNQGNNDNKEKPQIAVVNNVTENKEHTKDIFSQILVESDVLFVDKTEDELKELVNDNGYKGAIIINSPTDYTYMTDSTFAINKIKTLIDKAMRYQYQLNIFDNNGVNMDIVNSINNVEIEGNLVNLDGANNVDKSNNFLYAYILSIVLYVAVCMYGQFVAVGVATEKSSRTMEVLISSARPFNLMFAKVVSAGSAGLLQITALLASSFIFYNINIEFWKDNFLVKSIFNMPFNIILYTLLFFILGFFIYASLFAAVVSFVSRVEDVNMVVTPLLLVFIAVFMVVMTNLNNVDSIVMQIASYIPFSSPMAMFARIALGSVSNIEIIISVVILIASTFIIGAISAKMYRVGTLMYGNTPTMKVIIKAMKIKY